MRFMHYQILFSLAASLLGLATFKSRAWKLALAEVEPEQKALGSDSPSSTASSAARRGFMPLSEPTY